MSTRLPAGVMKCLTICQPWAHLIIHGVGAGTELYGTEWRFKTIENRTWNASYRGLLGIHAGMSRTWLQPGLDALYGFREADLAFGALIGVVDMHGCRHVSELPRNPWKNDHGYGHLYRNPRPLLTPVKLSGKQQFWDIEVPEIELGETGTAVGAAPRPVAAAKGGATGMLFGGGGRML